MAERLLAPAARPAAEEFTVAMYGYVALTPALLVGVSLADAVGDRRTQNIPGTSDEYPNWRVPLCDSEGKAVLLEDLPDIELVQFGGPRRHSPGTADRRVALSCRPGRRAPGSAARARHRRVPRTSSLRNGAGGSVLSM